jgi:quinol monooxygenase YgiN
MLMSVTQIYFLEARDGCATSLVDALGELAALIGLQSGCENVEILTENEDAGRFVFIERWQSEKSRLAAVTSIGQGPFAALKNLVSSSPRTHRLTRLNADRSETPFKD